MIIIILVVVVVVAVVEVVVRLLWPRPTLLICSNGNDAIP